MLSVKLKSLEYHPALTEQEQRLIQRTNWAIRTLENHAMHGFGDCSPEVIQRIIRDVLANKFDDCMPLSWFDPAGSSRSLEDD